MKISYFVIVGLTLALLQGPLTQAKESLSPFEARYDEFGSERLYPIRPTDLKLKGKNITSCLVLDQQGIREILSRAKRPERYMEVRSRLYLRLDGEDWFVDEPGVVRHNGHDFALSDQDYVRLRTLLIVDLPCNDPSVLAQPFKRVFARS